MNQVRAPQPLQTPSLSRLSKWLRCPNCFTALDPADSLVLSCPNGHRFDVNRRGYVSLLTGSRKLIGDSPAMLDARDAFLEHGWYADVLAALSERLALEPGSNVIDIGCGTGYYLRGVLTALAARHGDPAGAPVPPARALAVDLSAPAVARTVRASTRVPGTTTSGLVADVWSPLPIRDGAADILMNVFAPRNPREFHRILAPGGLLAVVVPHPTHLRELRAAGLALDVHENKTTDLVESLAGLFELAETRDLSRVLALSAGDVAALIGMGPSAHHQRTPAAGSDDEHPATTAPPATDVTVAFRLLFFRRSD